ncbi:MAG TPA: L,D-transpeptidase family protein [Gaiellaceae bacterium]|nr:L,D-transpeptidase family protein [Gaiellaceae bacterium]
MSYRRYRATRAGRRALAVFALVAAIVVGIEAGARAQKAAGGPEEHLVAEGVTVAGVDLSGLDATEAERALRKLAARPLTVVHQGRAWRYAPATLGASADVEDAAQRALAAPAGTSLLVDVTVDERRLDRWLRRFEKQFERKPRSAQIVLKGLHPHVTQSRFGRSLVEWSTRSRVLSELRAGDRGPVALDVKIKRPRVTRDEVGPAIVIRRASNRLYFYRGAGQKGMKVARKFRVATGTAVYPTPLGSFEIVDLQRDPWWYPPDSDWAAGAEPVPPGPGNPLGTRWMGLSEPLIGIHGTPDAASIGYSASHGCIRMLVPEAEWLFERVKLGTPVYILDA